jgi:CheY-like chemotaxis protein
MLTRVISTLHVEDDRIQRAVVAKLLKGVAPDHEFEMVWAADENEAVRLFQHQPHQLVLLDYELAQGDGLGCLQRIRRLDPIVPIIALSGTATAEVAAALVRAGADDFVSKNKLSTRTLHDAVFGALARSEGVRGRGFYRPGSENWRTLTRDLVSEFVAKLGVDWFEKLNRLETVLRQADVAPEEIRARFTALLDALAQEHNHSVSQLQRMSRPVLLEILAAGISKE